MPELSDAAAWFRHRTLETSSDAPAVTEMLAGRRVSVVIPARNEEATIGSIVSAIREHLVDEVGLVHEIVVVDSRSSDATTIRAGSEGAIVHRVPRHGPDGPLRDGGKGEALRAGLARMSGDVGVFLDADVTDFDPAFVVRLLAPLLADPTLVLVKGFYDRPGTAGGGGRVTELVARPLLARLEPRLLGLAQPLAGECSFVREHLARLPFVTGYGVETGLLFQVLRAHGLDALGQTDLGHRAHSHQDLAGLARMAVQVESAMHLCLDDSDPVDDGHLDGSRVAFIRGADGAMEMRRERVPTWLLPPLTEEDQVKDRHDVDSA